MARNPAVSRAVIDVANASKNPEDKAALAAARANLAAANIEAAIQRALATAPPIPAERRAQIARLLTGGER